MKTKSFKLVSLIVVLTMLLMPLAASAAPSPVPLPTVTADTFPETSTIPVWTQATAPTPLGPDDPLTKIEPLLLNELSAANQTDFFIWMTEKADLSLAYTLKTKEEKGRFVYETLVETAERTQKEMRAYLDQQGVSYRPFYITNKILVQGGPQTLLLNVASSPNVARITANHHFQLEEPLATPNSSARILGVETNMTLLK